MRNIFRVFFIAIVAVSLASCAKETKEEQKKLLLLTNPKGWLTEKIETSTGNGVWTDETYKLTPLKVDDLLFFSPDYTWWDDEGATKFPGDPQLIDFGTYSLIDDRSKIQKDTGDLLEIIELTKTSMILQWTKNNVVTKQTYKLP